MATPAAVLSILVEAQGLAKTSKQIRGLDTDLDKAGKTGSRSGSAIKKMAGVVGGIVAFDTLRRGVGLAVGEFEEARKVGAQTTAVIKSTGGAAHVTSKNVNDLAAALSKKAGIDDEVIQSGENMLLTFRGIRNETGKGNDIFNQATKAALDMSVAMGTDMKSSALQLGKALNDPTKGMTRLQRSGVTFTDQQKKQIETLQKSGDTLGAQKIMLHELSKEFGGSAAAAATPLDKLKVAGLNLAEAAGSVLVPAIDKIARFMTKFVNQMIEGKSVGGALITVFRNTGDVVGGLVGAISNIVGWFKKHTTVTEALAAALGVVLAAFIGFKILAAVQAAIMAVQGAMVALNVAMAMNPIALVVLAVAALVAAFVIAYKESKTFRDIVNAVFGALKDAAGAVVEFVSHIGELPGKAVEAGKAITSGIVDGIKALPGLLADAAKWLLNTAVDGVKAYIGAYKALGTWILDRIVDGFKVITGLLSSVGGWLRNRFVDFVHAEINGAKAIGSWLLNRVVDGFKVVTGLLSSVGGWLKNRFVDFVHAEVAGITNIGGWVLGSVVDGFKVVAHGLGTVGNWLLNRVKELVVNAKDGFLGIGGMLVGWIVDGLKTGANAIIGFVNKIIDVINVIPGVPNIKHIKGLAQGGVHAASATAVQGFANGGAFAKTGGLVTRPITLMGEEAPRHPEFVIPTNPAYRGRAQQLLAAAGAVLGGGVGIGSQGMGRQTAFKIGGVFGGGIDAILDLVADGGKALISRLPNPGEMLPKWIQGLGSWTLEHVKKWIAGKIGSLLGGPGGDWAGVPPDGRIAAMVAMANRMDMMDIPYGAQGHSGWPINPYGEDCSSTVSKVLHAAGYLSSVLTTVGLPGALAAGSGKYVTVHDRALPGNAGHTVIQIGSKVFGTSNSNPGGGPGWINPGSGYLSTLPTKLHPAGLAMGGLFGLPFLGSFHSGGVARTEGFAHVSAGERMTPAGAGPEIHVYIGDRELTDMVDVRIVERDRQSSRTYRAGVLR